MNSHNSANFRNMTIANLILELQGAEEDVGYANAILAELRERGLIISRVKDISER